MPIAWGSDAATDFPRHRRAIRCMPYAGDIGALGLLDSCCVPQTQFVADHEWLVEEEAQKTYKAEHYYPAKLGEVLNERYSIIGKLGFGSASAVWLCRDIEEQHDYVAVKVSIDCPRFQRELPIYKRINDLNSSHPGQGFIRKLWNSFEVQGSHGMHICLVHQPLGMSLGEMKDLAPAGHFSAELARETLRCILSGLQFLHKEARVIHTDLQPSNLLVGIPNDSTLTKFEQYELECPCPRKELEDRTIYMSRPMPFTKGLPSITDFSEGRFGDDEHTDLIMPAPYRAPEVILGLTWSYPVDIWGFTMVLWDLFQPKRLFFPPGAGKKYSEVEHLAQMVAVMGPPPLEFLRQCGDKAKQVWDDDGNWIESVDIEPRNLEDIVVDGEGKEKVQFLAFVRKMLQWNPEDRPNSEDLYWDEWFLADLIESGDIVYVEE